MQKTRCRIRRHGSGINFWKLRCNFRKVGWLNFFGFTVWREQENSYQFLNKKLEFNNHVFTAFNQWQTKCKNHLNRCSPRAALACSAQQTHATKQKKYQYIYIYMCVCVSVCMYIFVYSILFMLFYCCSSWNCKFSGSIDLVTLSFIIWDLAMLVV